MSLSMQKTRRQYAKQERAFWKKLILEILLLDELFSETCPQNDDLEPTAASLQ